MEGNFASENGSSQKRKIVIVMQEARRKKWKANGGIMKKMWPEYVAIY
jgi:hypothetical protein